MNLRKLIIKCESTTQRVQVCKVLKQMDEIVYRENLDAKRWIEQKTLFFARDVWYAGATTIPNITYETFMLTWRKYANNMQGDDT